MRHLPTALALALLLAAPSARAIPSFARQYGTSCTTCHTVYPKLTPFGEAFRRNGFKFPGKDSDYIKADQVPLGQPEYAKVFPNAVWPAVLAAFSTLSLGANGQAVLHPSDSGAKTADNDSVFTLHDLIGEAHLWAGGTISEHIAYFGEVTFSSDGTIDLEHAELHFDDLLGPKHLVNFYVGRGFPTLTSFGPHSSYLADTRLPGLGVTALFGATSESFSTVNEYNLIEANGMYNGRLIYSVGVNSGSNLDVRNSENVYGHLGVKLGGMRLDGEGDTHGDPNKPWAENALTFDAFGIRSASRYQPGTPAMGMAPSPADDLAYVAGASMRGQLGSLELDAGFFYEWHNHATFDGSPAQAYAQWDEISYVVFPWLVPALRIEYARVMPTGSAHVSDVKIIPGVAALVRPNLKLTLTGQIEWADGVPDAGCGGCGSWGAFGGSAAPMTGAVTELESIQLGAAFAF
jgi:hypothetical protein